MGTVWLSSQNRCGNRLSPGIGKELPGGPGVTQRATLSQQEAKLPKTSPVKNRINLKVSTENLQSF